MLTLQEIVDRARAGGEYQEVARRLGVNKATVSRWVQGIGAPAPEHVVELARLAGLSVAAVAIAALAARDRRQAKAKAWEQAWTQLARAGLATVALSVGLGLTGPSPAETGAKETAYYGKRRRRRQEAVPPATRRLSQLSGWRHTNNPLYTLLPIQRRLQRTLRRACCHLGLLTCRRTRRAWSWPTPAWARA